VQMKDRLRLAASVALALPLAAIVGLHSLSNAKFTTDAEGALALNPANGPARANLAFERLYSSIEPVRPNDPNDAQEIAALAKAALSKAAANGLGEARHAYQLEPLSPQAQTVLALAEPRPDARNQILEIASGLNKRQLMLQGMVLDKNIAEGSYPKTIETLDQILRVHPRESGRFFPILAQVLTLDTTLPQFIDLFAKPLPWRQQFLSYALGEAGALKNLAALRTEVTLEDTKFDSRLISRLVEQGHLEEARSVYNVVRPGLQVNATSGHIEWQSDYPPFEWRLASERGLRADVIDGGSAILVDVLPGRGGVLASRLVPPAGPRFVVSIEHELDLAGRSDQVKLRLVCFETGEPVLDKQIIKPLERFVVETTLSRCRAYILEISGRAWTGSRALQGRVRSVKIDS